MVCAVFSVYGMQVCSMQCTCIHTVGIYLLDSYFSIPRDCLVCPHKIDMFGPHHKNGTDMIMIYSKTESNSSAIQLLCLYY